MRVQMLWVVGQGLSADEFGMETSLRSITVFPWDHVCPSDTPSLPEHAALGFQLQKQVEGVLLPKPLCIWCCTIL